jgi:RhtB (resistance to homoserine/threonine) family protein
MDIHFLHWLTFVGIFFVAVISPGPDFVMLVRNSLSFSRKAGVFTALGLGLSILVHVTYTLLGLAAVISKSILLFNAIKWAGAAYLLYIGFQALFSKGMSQGDFKSSLKKKAHAMSNKQAFISGFLTNLLNPKAALFFLAIFSQVIGPETPLFWKLLSGVSASVIITSWFTGVAFFLTGTAMRNVFLKLSKWLDRACGAALIALGVKIALSAKN